MLDEIFRVKERQHKIGGKSHKGMYSERSRGRQVEDNPKRAPNGEMEKKSWSGMNEAHVYKTCGIEREIGRSFRIPRLRSFHHLGNCKQRTGMVFQAMDRIPKQGKG